MGLCPPAFLRTLGQILVRKSGIMSCVLGTVSCTYHQILSHPTNKTRQFRQTLFAVNSLLLGRLVLNMLYRWPSVIT
jgi:hypothetical protein